MKMTQWRQAGPHLTNRLSNLLCLNSETSKEGEAKQCFKASDHNQTQHHFPQKQKPYVAHLNYSRMLTSTFNHLLTHPGRRGDQLLLYFIVFNQITMLQKQQAAIIKNKAPLSSTRQHHFTFKPRNAIDTSKEHKGAKEPQWMEQWDRPVSS